MRCELTPHPDFPCAAVDAITVETTPVGRGALAVRYTVRGDLSELAIPAPAAPARTDELWRHTCLEAFVSHPAGYLEWNLSPSARWAAYAFDGYRAGMRPADAGPPRIQVLRRPQALELSAVIEVPGEAERLGLAAVIEESGGRLSYWALRHPSGRPDFHHADGFAIELPAPSGA